jgi:hypothetical protein
MHHDLDPPVYGKAHMKSKASCQIKHARRRALQRYGLCVSEAQIDQIVQMIKQQKARFVAKQSCRVSIWEIDWEGKKAKVVYDRSRETIASFLPMGAWEDPIY